MYKIYGFMKGVTLMKSFLTRIILFSILFILFIPNLTSAETKTFIQEYTYHTGDEDYKYSY